MKSTLLLLVLCALSTPAALAQHGPIPVPPPTWAKPNVNSIIPEERQGLWLVEAESVGRQGLEPHSIVKITHNYSGPNELVGRKFRPIGQQYTGAPLFPLTPLGSKGIFVVEWNERGGIIRDSIGYGYSFPVLEEASERVPQGLFRFSHFQFSPAPYFEGRAYGASLQLIAKAPREEQIRLLKSYTREPFRELSSWAVHALAQSDLPEAPQFLLDLVADGKVAISTQMAADAQLQRLDAVGKVQWNDSPARLELWQRLVSSPINKPEEGNLIVDSIIATLRPQNRPNKAEGQKTDVPPIPPARVFQWLRLAMPNKSWPLPSRKYALAQLARSELSSIPRKEKWDLALFYLKEHPDLKMGYKPPSTLEESTALGIVAIRIIKAWRPFAADELEVLQDLQLSAIDPTLQKDFAATLETKSPRN